MSDKLVDESNEIEKFTPSTNVINGNSTKDIGIKGGNKIQEQHSNQLNRQDLEQEQNVDVKPSQVNVQKVEVTVSNKLENYSGRIEGGIYIQKSDIVVPDVDILLFFGTSGQYPVYKTKSDDNGNYKIEDIPPGFYTIKAKASNGLSALVFNIKVLPGQTAYENLLLR